jgi:hypothetical protein
VNPGADEITNGLDDNCNGLVDEMSGGNGVPPEVVTNKVPGVDYCYATVMGWPIGSGNAYTHASDGDSWYVCTEFHEATPCGAGTTQHLGEDWNREGVNDQGEAVLAVGAGVVVMATTSTPGWGKVIVVRHDAPPGGSFALPGGGTASYVYSQYAHLQNFGVSVGASVTRGQKLAEIGPKAYKSTAPHLHWEISSPSANQFPGKGYSASTEGRVDPTEFVVMNQTVTAACGASGQPCCTGACGGAGTCNASLVCDLGGVCHAAVGCNNDGIKDAAEACDGPQLGGATCQSQGYSGGVLKCTGCALDQSACCNDECVVGNTHCLNASTMQTCGNYDADTCQEWGGNSSCASGCNSATGKCNNCVPACANKCGGAPDGCGGVCSANCGGGTVCLNQACAPCGGSGQLCCPNNTCNAPLACSGGACACVPDCSNKCGGAPDGCGGTCNGNCGGGTVCLNQSCAACGGNAQPCCQNSMCNSPLACNGGTCGCVPSCSNKCGGAPDGCGGSCNAGCGGGGTVCQNQSCVPCGSNGQTCCQNNACNAPLTCTGGACTQCNPSCSGKCGGASDGCGGTCNGNCGANQHCSGVSCVSCNYSSNIAANDTIGCGGGLVMNVQGSSVDALGKVTIKAKKNDLSTFGSGDYYVFVYDPNDGNPGNHCNDVNFASQKGHILVSGNPSQLTFSVFDSLLVCGGPEKAYCVTKAGNNHSAWFCSSDELKAKYN